MKKLLFTMAMMLMLSHNFAQNCIDAVILQGSPEKTDTLFCKIISESPELLTIDNGYAITSIPQDAVIAKYTCLREMTAYELFRYEGLDNVTRDMFDNRQTAGSALRKAAYSTYISTGLAVVGATSFVLGVTLFKESKYMPVWVVGGSIVTAASLFFVIRGWNQIYKAGKLLDINKASLYLDATQDGDIGLILKF